jgi:quinol monooxygenase YgiN
MSIVVRFNPKNVTREKYDEVVRRLEQAGEWPHPPGLEFHVLYGSEGELRVSEIWDSRESLEAYGQTIFPIMGEVGIEMAGEPEIYEVQNIVKH